ncbi:hypothetical protein Tco_0150604 [Tanacetum coccineum]
MLDAKKKFVMYPRFIPVFLTNQLKNVPVPLDHFPINALTTKVFSFMVKKGKKNSRNVTPLFPSMLAQPTEDEGEVSERPSETQPTPSHTHPSEDQSEPQPDPFLRPSSSNPILDSIPGGSGGNHGGQSSSDRSISGNEDNLTLQSVYDLCVSLCKQSVSMKTRLAGKKSMQKKWMQKESVSKQGRKTAKSKPTAHKDQAFDDLDDFDAMDYMETEDAHNEKGVSTEDQVSTVKPDEGTDKPKVSTDKIDEGTAELKSGNSDESAAPTTVFRDDETIAQFLVTMSQNKTKQKGVEIKEIKDTDRPRTTTERSILTLKPLPKIDPKDKGKKVLEEKAESYTKSKGVNEAEKKFKMLANDEEIARKVQKEWEAEKEKKKLAEEEATKVAFTNEYDFIQARLNADKILAEKLQEEEEREKFTIEQRAKFLHDTIAAQRRFLAQQRSEAIRNKLPIRNHLRNQMMTYLKYVSGYKHAQLNKKKFEEIQVMYEKVKRANENFIPIGSAKDEKLIKKLNKKAAGMDKEEVSEEPESTKVKAKIEEPKENIRKRSGRRLKMKAPKRSKRQKTSSDHEEENQLRTFLKVVPKEEEKIDYEVLGTRYPIINWESKFNDYGHFRRELIYYRVFRADGSSRWIKTFSKMIKFFDRMDLVEIHSLVMKRFETTPPEGIDLLLWGDLRIMFESKEDDELWKNQEEWKLQSWIFYENYRVHVLRLEDGTEINMLAERRYPLTKNTLERMMDLRLTAVSDDDTVFDLLRFIEQQIDEFGGQDGSEKDL